METPNPYTVNRLRLTASKQVSAALECLDRLDVSGALAWYRDAIRTCEMAGLDHEAERLTETHADIAAFGRIHAGVVASI